MTTMPFGKYKGMGIKEIPSEYLEWLVFTATLREPLKSVALGEWELRDKRQREKLQPDRVRQLYKKLALKYHPDIIGGDGGIMKGINLFYEAIK